MKVGTTVQVSAKSPNAQYMTRLVGSDGSDSLLTLLPSITNFKDNGGRLTYEAIFATTNHLLMRVVMDGFVYGFVSEVYGTFSKHNKLLISSIPTQMQLRTLRQEVRYSCTHHSVVEIANESCEGYVTDISASGCQVRLTESRLLSLMQTCLKSVEPIRLKILLPYAKDYITLRVIIKSINKIDERVITMGLSFNGGTEPIIEYLDSLRLDNMPFII
jgi:hypothetical protein